VKAEKFVREIGLFA